MLPSTTMTSADRAAFAVSSRLLSCFVTEQILLAFYVSTPEIEHVAGLMIILSPTISAQPQGTLFPDDVLAVVLLGSAPVLLGGPATKYGRRIGLVDPLDMRPGILEYSTDKAYQKTVCTVHWTIPVEGQTFHRLRWSVAYGVLCKVQDTISSHVPARPFKILWTCGINSPYKPGSKGR